MKKKSPILSYAIIIIGAVAMVFPFLDMVMSSFKSPAELVSYTYHLLPKSFNLNNYTEAFKNMDMFKLFKNSIIVSVSVTLSVLLTSSLAGYALTKLRFKGRNLIFKFMLMTMMFPGFLFLIPNFFTMVHFPLVGGNNILGMGGYGGMTASRMALIFPFTVSAFGIFLMRQFIMGIPDSLIEAARIDGAGELRIFFQLIVPMTKPALATLAIFTFIAQWNELIWAMIIYTVNSELATLPVGIQLLKAFLDPLSSQALINAGLTISVVPIFIVFLFLQKHYIRGLNISGMKE